MPHRIKNWLRKDRERQERIDALLNDISTKIAVIDQRYNEDPTGTTQKIHQALGIKTQEREND